MWQVSGRSNITDFEEVVELDREYISHWNMGLDLDDKGNVLRVSYIYLSDTMEIWFDQSSRSNREENRKAEINPCCIACK